MATPRKDSSAAPTPTAQEYDPAQDSVTRRILQNWGLKSLTDIVGSDKSPIEFSDHLRKNLLALAKHVSLQDAREGLVLEMKDRLANGRVRGKRNDWLTTRDVQQLIVRKNVVATKSTPIVKSTIDSPEDTHKAAATPPRSTITEDTIVVSCEPARTDSYDSSRDSGHEYSPSPSNRPDTAAKNQAKPQQLSERGQQIKIPIQNKPKSASSTPHTPNVLPRAPPTHAIPSRESQRTTSTTTHSDERSDEQFTEARLLLHLRQPKLPETCGTHSQSSDTQQGIRQTPLASTPSSSSGFPSQRPKEVFTPSQTQETSRLSTTHTKTVSTPAQASSRPGQTQARLAASQSQPSPQATQTKTSQRGAPVPHGHTFRGSAEATSKTAQVQGTPSSAQASATINAAQLQAKALLAQAQSITNSTQLPTPKRARQPTPMPGQPQATLGTSQPRASIRTVQTNADQVTEPQATPTTQTGRLQAQAQAQAKAKATPIASQGNKTSRTVMPGSVHANAPSTSTQSNTGSPSARTAQAREASRACEPHRPTQQTDERHTAPRQPQTNGMQLPDTRNTADATFSQSRKRPHSSTNANDGHLSSTQPQQTNGRDTPDSSMSVEWPTDSDDDEASPDRSSATQRHGSMRFAASAAAKAVRADRAFLANKVRNTLLDLGVELDEARIKEKRARHRANEGQIEVDRLQSEFEVSQAQSGQAKEIEELKSLLRGLHQIQEQNKLLQPSLDEVGAILQSSTRQHPTPSVNKLRGAWVGMLDVAGQMIAQSEQEQAELETKRLEAQASLDAARQDSIKRYVKLRKAQDNIRDLEAGKAELESELRFCAGEL